MLTRKRFAAPDFSGDWGRDGPNLLRAISEYFLALEQKNALTISQAQIYVDQGLQLPATQAASSDANNLDDYAEVPWTPTDGSGAGLALTVVSARCTKVGRLVVGECKVTWPATANAAGAQLNGLPYVAANQLSGSLLATGAGGGTAVLISGSSLFLDAPNAVQLTNANMSGATAYIGFAYTV